MGEIIKYSRYRNETEMEIYSRTDNFTKRRIKANEFIEKQFKNNHRYPTRLYVSDVKMLASDIIDRHEISLTIMDAYNVGFLDGYKRAKAEMQKEQKRQKGAES